MKNLRTNQLKPVMAFLFLMLGLLIQGCNNGSNTGSDQDEIKVPDQSIHEAVFMGNLKAVEKHIQAGTDLNEKDQFGSSPLTIAITFGKIDVAKALIKGGADLKVTSADGSTALHTAAFFGRVEVVEQLLEKGIAIDSRNSFGVTALESVSTSFDEAKPIYDQISRDLGPLGLKLDYERLKRQREEIATMIKDYQ